MKPGRAWKRKRLLCTAEAFGFGPASKLLILLRGFPRRDGMRFTFLGDGCAYELCSSGRFDRLVQASPIDASAGSALERELAQSDVLVSAMEFAPIAAAKRNGLATILFDSLFWMWPQAPPALPSVDLYLCQNFLAVTARRSACGRPANLVVVPPLTLGCDGGATPGDAVVLNLGGMDNPHAPQPLLRDYALCMVGLVHEVCRKFGFPLEVHGRGWVMQALREQIAGGDVCLSSLPLDDFVRRLQRARGLITSPGLEVIYEAFTLGVPTCILPPQNNSQAYQARELRLVVPLLAGLDWQELVSIDLFSQDLSPAELIRGALDCVGCLRESPQAQHRMRETIAGFLGQDAAGRERVRQQQFQFIERMRAEADVHRIEELDLRIGSLLE